MPRYSRTESGEVIEHFDSKEELEARKREKDSEIGSFLSGFLFFVTGCIIGYLLLGKLSVINPSKSIKLISMLGAGIPLAVIGYKYGEFIFGLIVLAFCLVIAYAVGALIWWAL